jgi:F-type H+-transporting ATPase subunit delta
VKISGSDIMKITPKQYAQSLYESLKGEDKKHASEIVKKFFEVLVKNNNVGQMSRIIEQFAKIWNAENGIAESVVTSAKELDKETVKLLNGYIAEQTGAKEVQITEKVDKDILGGVVIRYGDQVLDGSLKTRISSLKEQMVK